MDFKKQLKEGLITQNPVTVQLLGMCSTMAITISLFNGIGMGLSVLVILTLSNIFISALRKIIPNKIRIACFIVVIATFVGLASRPGGKLGRVHPLDRGELHHPGPGRVLLL